MTSEYPKNVRIATIADKSKVLDFIRAGHEESAVFSLSEYKINLLAEKALTREAPVWIAVIDSPEKNEIAASICIEYCQMWYTEDWHLNELWNNVRKEYRKSSYARDLIAFAKWLSEQANRTLAMGIITNERVEAKMAMYRRKMPQVGAYFMWNTPDKFALDNLGVKHGRR